MKKVAARSLEPNFAEKDWLGSAQDKEHPWGALLLESQLFTSQNTHQPLPQVYAHVQLESQNYQHVSGSQIPLMWFKPSKSQEIKHFLFRLKMQTCTGFCALHDMYRRAER